MKKFLMLAAAPSLLIMQGCASIISGSTQSLSVTAHQTSGAPVMGAYCTLVNEKGTWFVTTPGSVSVHRAYDPLSVTCNKGDDLSGNAIANSSLRPTAPFFNITIRKPYTN